MEPAVLLIETATPVCSVALSTHQGVFIRESHEQRSHAELITLFIDEVVTEAGIGLGQLDAVAVSMGPGSYTGLRIGVSSAKGICYALDKPLIAIDTLQSMATGMAEKRRDNNQNELLCPMIDARRMEVYAALFNATGKRRTETGAHIIDETSFANELENNTIVFFGDGAPKCSPLLSHKPGAVFMKGFLPSAAYMAGIARQHFKTGKFENTAYFEPFYLKDFVAATPKVKGLR
jgi:tRNA threonylcarbamoyladenosine biosynthesis protein TsaB